MQEGQRTLDVCYQMMEPAASATRECSDQRCSWDLRTVSDL